MTLELTYAGVSIACDHPDCAKIIASDDHDLGAFFCRGVANAEGWVEKERPWRVDSWWLCKEHKKYRPEE